MQRLKGLTWDHPRGYNALAAAARRAELAESGLAIAWEKQPLEGFESHPIADLCARYDLVVLDHPHVGEAVEADCLQPLEAVFGADRIAELEAATIGPCLSSYRFAGRHWALPLDAATQVAVSVPELVPVAPETWAEVVDLAEREPVALSLAGPHAFLTFASICVAIGQEPAVVPGDGFVDDFQGTHFEWNAARAEGASADSPPATPDGGGGGYGY